MKRNSGKNSSSRKISVSKGLWSLARKKGGASLKFVLIGIATLLLSTGTAFGGSRDQIYRSLASVGFPIVNTERSSSDILDSYPAYLQFVVEVGKDLDRNNALKLVKIFDSLKRKNPRGAALFLKGLRFEMLQKVELMGREPKEISSSNSDYRKWVGKYLKEWVREADEHLFRAYSASKAELALAE